MPWPVKYFTSPLRRTLQTWELTWKDLKHETPLIKELARETYGIQTESKRHNKTYIHTNWPIFEFEKGSPKTMNYGNLINVKLVNIVSIGQQLY